MATLLEYFNQHSALAFDMRPEFFEDGKKVETIIAVIQDAEAGVKYLKIFVGECVSPDGVIAHIFTHMIGDFWKAEGDVEIISGMAGGTEAISSRDLKFSGRVIVYSLPEIDDTRWKHLHDQLARAGHDLVVRDSSYARLREKYDKPLAFLSHDSNDKDAFVRPLAQKLASMLCPVWYDEFSLKAGQSLRASIETGIKECGKCVVVLSPNFFSNSGWTAREFETIYQREIIEGRRLMIPIWLGVTKQQVFNYSPVLLDTLGISADLGLEEVAKRLAAALNYVPPERIS